MFRLFFLMIAVIFGYMLWRIVRVVSRGTRGETMEEDRPPYRPSAQTFKDVHDATFEDVQTPKRDDTAERPGPGT